MVCQLLVAGEAALTAANSVAQGHLPVEGEADLAAADFVEQGDSQASHGATELAVRDPPPPPPLAQDEVDMDAQFQLCLASQEVDECGRMALIPAAATPGTGSSSEVCQLLEGGGTDPTAAVRVSPSPSPIKHFEISERAYEGVLQWAKACPISREVERIVTENGGGPCSRHALYGWARQAASSASMERRASVVRKVMEYIASRLTASILSEHEDYRKELVSWIKNSFLSECSTLLPEKELEPLNDVLVSHGLIPRPSRALSRRLTAAPPLSPFARFRDLDDRCHVCFDPKPELVCGCGTGRCNKCSGAGAQTPAGRVFRCLWCLEKSKDTDPDGATLLVPDRAVTLCWECGCSMRSEAWCSTAARCKRCLRLYCGECIGVCPGDLTPASSRALGSGRKKTLEASRAVALITCRGCLGTVAYAETRRRRLVGIARGIFTGARDDPLALTASGMHYSNLLMNAKRVHGLGDYLYQLYYCGQREVFQEGLPLLLNVLCAQLGLGPDKAQKDPLDPAVGPFNFFHFLGLHELATTKMLESICRASVFHAIRKGEVLKQVIARSAPSVEMTIPEQRPAKLRVGLFAYDLVKDGPLAGLVSRALQFFAEKDGLEVYLVALGTPDKYYPPAKSLADFFRDRGRLIILPEKCSSAQCLNKLLECKLHVLVSFAGWTTHDFADVLHVLSKWVLVVNWLSYAGLMHGIAHVTVAGPAVGAGQIQSKTRERIASVPCYQAPQSDPYFDKVRPEWNRSFFNIPAGFIMFFPGSTNRLRQESIETYLLILQLSPGSCILLLDRPLEMRQTILDWVLDYNRTSENPVDPLRFIFRNWMEDKIQYLALIDAIVREGEGGCGIDSLGAVSVHTGANDCMIRGCPLFTWRNPSGAMPSRVAAEVVTAAGLEKVCVADTRQGVVTLVVNYWRDKVLRERLKAFMARTQESRIGFFDEQRIPDALHRIVEHYFSEFMRTRGDRTQLKDQHFAYDGRVEIFATDSRAATRKKLLEEMNVEDGMQETAESLLHWLECELDAEFTPGIVGRGGSTVTLCARHTKGGNEVLTAVKVAIKGGKKERLHNESLCREGLCLWLWHNKMRNHEFKSLLPEPHRFLANGTSFLGHSLPNSDGRVLAFLLCELIPRKFADVAAPHKVSWQQGGVLHDTFRLDILLPLFQSLFWAERKGLFLMDIKPDNLGKRSDGTLAFLDVGQGCVCPVRDSPIPRDAEGMVLIDRQCSSMEMAESAGTQEGAQKKRKQPIRPGALLQGRARGTGGVAITRADLSRFQRLAGQRGGLANNGGGGTMGFRNEDEVTAHKLLIKEGNDGSFARRFEPKHGYARDRFAAFRTVLFTLTHRQDVSMIEWDAEALAAAKGGRSEIRAMLLRAVRSGVEVQQKVVLERLVDFLFEGLRPETAGAVRRLSSKEAMTDEMATLPILPPRYAVQLAAGLPIGLQGGPLKQFLPDGYWNVLDKKDQDAVLPPLSFVNQPGMGMGMAADEEIPGGAVVALYVGHRAPNGEIGKEYAVRDFPSRYSATVQGVKFRGGTGLEDKVTCDAQLTADRDFEWHVTNCIGGPFMNAANTQADANCVLDRHSVWLDRDTGLVWMLMRTRPDRPVAKGEFLMWTYSPTAGAGLLWSFKLRS